MGARRLASAAIPLLLGWGGPAQASELLLAAGSDHLRGHPSFALGIEGRVDPFLEWRTGEQAIGLALAAALETDSDHDAWGGAGLLLTMPLRRGSWRLEFSFMPGLYAFGIGEDLGKHTLVYRSQFGISRGCATRWRIGLSLGHKSNGGTAEKNPGSETVLLAMHRVF